MVTSPLVIPFSLCSRSRTKSLPTLGWNGGNQVFGVTGLEVDGSRLPLIDGKHVGLCRRLLHPPPKTSVPTINFIGNEPRRTYPSIDCRLQHPFSQSSFRSEPHLARNVRCLSP